MNARRNAAACHEVHTSLHGMHAAAALQHAAAYHEVHTSLHGMHAASCCIAAYMRPLHCGMRSWHAKLTPLPERIQSEIPSAANGEQV